MVAQQTASRLAAVTALTAVVLLAAGPAAGQTHRALAVGNSYSFYNQPQHAAGVYEALVEAGVGGWETAETQLVAGGGYTLADHAADLNAATALAEALVTGTGAPFAWDVVILQDQSLVPGLGPLDGLYAASLAGLETLDEAVQARGADTVLMQTWGRRDGASQLAWLYPDFETMNDLLAEGYAAYQVAITTPERTAWVAPVGAAFARIHADISAGGVDPVTDGTLFHRLYTSDGSHPSDLGSFLAGCVLFATVTGHDPGGVWVPEGVAPADADVLAKAARRVVIDEPFEPLAFPFGERPRYPWVFDWSSWVAANPADEPIVSHPTMRATVSLAADLGAMARLEIGADHDGAQGAGRLVLVDHSAKLDLGELVVGGGGDGTMSQNGGIVTADTLVLGESAEANGRYTLTAGALRVGALTHGAGSGSFSMSGGTLVAAQISAGLLQGGGALQVAHDEATMIDGVYFQQAGATLKVAAAGATGSQLLGGHVEATEQVDLAGTVDLDITSVPEGERVLDVVVAASIDADDASIDAPEPFEAEVVDLDDGRQALRITLNPGEPLPPGEADSPATETETDAATGSGGPDTEPVSDDAGPSDDDAGPGSPDDVAGAGDGAAVPANDSQDEDGATGSDVTAGEGDTGGGSSGGGASVAGSSSGGTSGGDCAGASRPSGLAGLLGLALLLVALRRRRRDTAHPASRPTASL